MTVEGVRDEESLPDPQTERLGRAVDTITEAVEVTRSLSSRFAPPVGNQSLIDTLDWLAGKMEEYHDLSVSVLSRDVGSLHDETLKTVLYRAVRELLFNVVKHAGTSEARVYVIGAPERLRIVVEDDGRGLSEENQLPGGLGLPSIRERLKALEGRLDVETKPTGGTRAVVEVPRPGGESHGGT
jgi:signal transduction histidine kinase